MNPRHYGSFREYAESETKQADCAMAPMRDAPMREVLHMRFLQRREFVATIDSDLGGAARAVEEAVRHLAGMQDVDPESIRFEVTQR